MTMQVVTGSEKFNRRRVNVTHMCVRQKIECKSRKKRKLETMAGRRRDASQLRKLQCQLAFLLPIVLFPTEQFCQTCEATTSLQELMGQKLFGGGTAADVDTETDAEEGLELLAQFLGFLQTRSTIGGNEVQRFERFLVQVWRLRLDHFNSHNSKRPAVNLGAVFLLFDHFRGHPVRSSHHRGTLVLGVGQFGAESEIRWEKKGNVVSIVVFVLKHQTSKRWSLTNFDMTSAIKEDIVTLDITVDNALAVQMGKSFASLVVRAGQYRSV